MSPSDQRLRANLVHVDAEGGSGMIFATAVTKMLQPADKSRLPGPCDLFRAPTGGGQDGDNSTALPSKEQAGGPVNGR